MLNRWQMRDVRANPSTHAVEGTAWLLLADRNTCGNTVHLAHAERDEAHSFPHQEPYREFLKAQIKAEQLAHSLSEARLAA